MNFNEKQLIMKTAESIYTQISLGMTGIDSLGTDFNTLLNSVKEAYISLDKEIKAEKEPEAYGTPEHTPKSED